VVAIIVAALAVALIVKNLPDPGVYSRRSRCIRPSTRADRVLVNKLS